MPDLLVAEQLRAHLITQGIVRAWGTPAATSADPPPCLLDPRTELPEPITPDLATVALVKTGQAPRPQMEGFLEDAIVEVWVRATTSPRVELLHRDIRAQLDDRRGWDMGDLRVEYSHLWRGVQPMGTTPLTYTSFQSFVIAARVAALLDA